MTETPAAGEKIYRHSLVARITHWCWTLAMLVLVMSGLQIFVAAPYLDASDKSNPDRRILSIDAHQDQTGKPVGTTTIFGHTFVTTHVLGFADDGQGGEVRARVPRALTLPAVQDLADGRTWHLFFAWVLTLSIITYLVNRVHSERLARARAAAVGSAQAVADAVVLFSLAQRAAAAREV